ALRLVSPGHDDGALVRAICVYEADYNQLDLGFVANELAVLQRYLDLEPEKCSLLATAMAAIDWSALPDRQKFEQSLFQVRSSLQNLNHGLKQHRIQLLGHAHLDLAWLWPLSETWEAAQRTFESVLQLQQEFPQLIFCHSTPALYAWIEANRPDLFAAIQQQVVAGRWEVVGGFWVEPELNLVNGESIVRQVLYGQRYVLEKFGKISTIAWLPDSFGFSWILPQILKQGGIEYFVTQKLRWNDTTEFPYGAFWWRSLDGTQIFSLMSAPIGEGIEPLRMIDYARDWENQTSLLDTLWLPGVGDHGGGPTRDMLEIAQRWQKSPYFPQLEFTTAQSYLQHISSHTSRDESKDIHPSLPIPSSPHPPTPPPSPFPIWEDELYLEFHRGCYTSHAEQKWWNRHCEGLLYQAELFAALATQGNAYGSSGDALVQAQSCVASYPQAELEAAWKQVLFNQFHDILPGSSIPQVYVDANQAWQEVEQVGEEILQQSLSAIANQISFPMPPQPDALPIVVFNPLNWQRSEVVAVSLPVSFPNWEIYDLEAHELPTQMSSTSTLLFLARDIPSVGYRVFWLCRGKGARPSPENLTGKDWVLENNLLRVVIEPKTGNLSSIFDKLHHREILNQLGGNQLQAFQDSGQYWDAWNIDPNYAQHPLPSAELKSIQWVECGPVQSCVRVVRQLGQSEFCQDYILQVSSSVLKIATTVDWQERQVLVKAAFPLNLEADYASYEIACGAIRRPTKPKTPAEQAKWEVPALHWADLSAADYGVSLLNDCKYGYDSQPQQLRLTLLRSPSWPDPEADRGFHKFTYAIYPHKGSWQSAHSVRRGYELNLPLQVMLLPAVSNPISGQLPSVGRLLDLSDENLILMAFKQSEADPQKWILRCYECHGELAYLSLQSDLGLVLAHPVNLLEELVGTHETSSTEQTFKIEPWKIANFTVLIKN
ncbi:MAG: alpha-mannosidase, partial [Chroococcidiopsidaceae cyanobacterium CP_BM_RX_35]|nr:alpha-mannosidase [Chroococcidiopsidaceae cyanobacterium CP_BM_RX_35]